MLNLVGTWGNHCGNSHNRGRRGLMFHGGTHLFLKFKVLMQHKPPHHWSKPLNLNKIQTIFSIIDGNWTWFHGLLAWHIMWKCLVNKKILIILEEFFDCFWGESFFGIRVVDVVNLFFKWKMPLLTLEEHKFYKSKRNWMIQKLNKVSIERLQIIFILYHQLSDN